MRSAADFAGRPGIVCMSPHTATIQPAPVYGRSSRTGSVKPVGASISAGSCESERCVFAMHTGSRPSPSPRTAPPGRVRRARARSRRPRRPASRSPDLLLDRVAES